MKRLTFLLILLAGCNKPCDVTSDCGNGESCVAAHCSALSCDDTWYAVDPSTGVCTPLSGCADHSTVGSWTPCSDPCAGLAENACKASSLCQASYTGEVVTPAKSGGAISTTPPSTAIPGTYRSCHAVAQPVDPCKALDATACQADSRCEIQAQGGPAGCGCPADSGPCDCSNGPASPICGLKFCGELTSASECNARPDCTTTADVEPVAEGGVATSNGGTAQPASAPFSGCFSVGNGSCASDEATCEKQHECVPVYSSGGKFQDCVPQDFSIHCSADGDCPAGDRCNDAGICVVQGCTGEDEVECNADLHCQPIYTLNCSPYANGPTAGAGDGDVVCGGSSSGGAPSNGKPSSNGATAEKEPAMGGCGMCQPSFSSCQPSSGGCDVEKSVLVRDPAIVDDPFWALPRVLGLVTGADANSVANGLLGQLGTAQTVSGQTAAARPGAAAFIAALPRTSAGLIDASQIGFQPTALSNRIDLADGTSCGEARITYALSTGVTDNRHRMTLIVEMRQPYDGAGCRTTAKTWVALSQLSGAALQSALQSIYTPLLTPANLKQIRTNEFLVGPQDPTQPNAAWELREFHLGTDSLMHQALLPLQIDPTAAASSPDFLTWAQANQAALQRGTINFPAQYQVPTGSEDGTTVSLSDPTVANIVNASTCAGCHTTATNSAFAHVAERFNGTGRAEISQFLAGALTQRANHLGLVAAGAVGAPLEFRPLH